MDAETRRTAKAMEGQRRQVTVMFTDMQGYTATSEKLGEDRTYQLMQMVFEAMVGAVHAHQGTVQELTGDGLMALFGAPVALEDAPVRACRAGLEIHECIAALGDNAEAQFGVRPKFRIGINTGPLVIGSIGEDMQMEFTALGDTVNYASRVESLAETGTVFISDATRALVEGYVDATDLGERTVKGKSEPHRASSRRLEGENDAVRCFGGAPEAARAATGRHPGAAAEGDRVAAPQRPRGPDRAPPRRITTSGGSRAKRASPSTRPPNDEPPCR